MIIIIVIGHKRSGSQSLPKKPFINRIFFLIFLLAAAAMVVRLEIVPRNIDVTNSISQYRNYRRWSTMWPIHRDALIKRLFYDFQLMDFGLNTVCIFNITSYFINKRLKQLTQCSSWFFPLYFPFLVFGKSAKPCEFSINNQTTDAFLKLLDGFMIVVTCRGQIVIVSTSVEKYLGHCQVCSIFYSIFRYL